MQESSLVQGARIGRAFGDWFFAGCTRVDQARMFSGAAIFACAMGFGNALRDVWPRAFYSRRVCRRDASWASVRKTRRPDVKRRLERSEVSPQRARELITQAEDDLREMPKEVG